MRSQSSQQEKKIIVILINSWAQTRPIVTGYNAVVSVKKFKDKHTHNNMMIIFQQLLALFLAFLFLFHHPDHHLDHHLDHDLDKFDKAWIRGRKVTG